MHKLLAVLFVLLIPFSAQAVTTNVMTPVGGGSDDSSSLSSASSIGPIDLSPGIYTIASNLTLSSCLTIESGAVLSVSSGKTLTINTKCFSSPIEQVFSGAGTVVFGNGTISTDYPEWFGAKGDGTTNDMVAIQNAINAYPNGYGRVFFSANKYLVSGTVNVTQHFITLEGSSYPWRYVNTTQIVSSSSTATVLSLLGTSAGGDGDGSLEGNVLKNIYVSRTAMGAVGSITVSAVNTLYNHFDHAGWSLSQTGLYIKNANSIYLEHVMGTIGGDLSANVYGIWVDGLSQISSGIVINGYQFSGGQTPSGTTYVYYDVGKSGSLGDRRLQELEFGQQINYGVYMADASGWSSDVSIRSFVMDGIQNAGIYINSGNGINNSGQQVNIESGWMNLINSSGASYGIWLDGRGQTNITNVGIANGSVNTNVGVFSRGSQFGTITGSNFNQNQFYAGIILDTYSPARSDGWSITGNTASTIAPLMLNVSSSSTITGNTMPTSPLTIASGSNNNVVTGNIFSSITNSGSGNIINGGGGGGSPGGSSGQVQYNSSGSFGGFTVSGDASLNTSTGALTVTKTSGTSFAASATTDTTNASNITSGTIPSAQLPVATASVLGGVKCDGTTITCTSGVISATGGGGGSGFPTGTSWTPTDASGGSLTFSTSQGSYTQSGSVVLYSGVVIYPTTSDTHSAALGSFPVSCGGGGKDTGSIDYATTSSLRYLLMNAGGGAGTTASFFSATGGPLTNAALSGAIIYFHVPCPI